jgi:anti-sigma regulatory factor (Ser/Thr protein kinase)
VIGPRPAEGLVDGDSSGVASWPNALAGPSDGPPAAGAWPQPDPFTPGSCPSAAPLQNGGPDGPRRDWRLPATESSVTILRRGLIDFLREADLSGDERYDLLLAVCEAASNAIEHARDPTEPFFDVLTEIGEARVTVVVRDHGQWSDGPPGADPGRGMAMMWMLADSTVVPSPQGTTVTIRSSPRHGRHPVAQHGERGTAGGSPPSSSAARGA